MSHPAPFPDLMKVPASAATVALTPEPGLTRRVLAHNERMMLVEHHMDMGWAGARHAHPHEQLVYIISGRFRFSCGPETFEVAAGDSFVIRGGVETQAWALEPGVMLDVFTPMRADYLPSA